MERGYEGKRNRTYGGVGVGGSLHWKTTSFLFSLGASFPVIHPETSNNLFFCVIKHNVKCMCECVCWEGVHRYRSKVTTIKD